MAHVKFSRHSERSARLPGRHRLCRRHAGGQRCSTCGQEESLPVKFLPLLAGPRQGGGNSPNKISNRPSSNPSLRVIAK
ncbi:MAG: hypothetical protein ABH822_01025 [Patescibacteria group bacterium]